MARTVVIDCDAGRAWMHDDADAAIEYAAGLHRRSGHVIEVVREDEQLAVYPADAPAARPPRAAD